MLSETLLDSSPTREPVLQRGHWLIAVAAAVAGFCLAWFGLPLVEAPLTKMLATQSLILAAVCFFSALMLVYGYADSRHLRLRTWPWLTLTFLLNIGSFIAYLVYSAAKTGNWKRASLPLAYTIEVVVIGLMIIIPLAYTEALPKASRAIAWIPSPPTARPAQGLSAGSLYQEGTVRLEAVIATDGTIKNLEVRSGHPLLVRVVLEAVEQWRYRPTLLNGQPVEVETEIDVNFALGQ